MNRGGKTSDNDKVDSKVNNAIVVATNINTGEMIDEQIAAVATLATQRIADLVAQLRNGNPTLVSGRGWESVIGALKVLDNQLEGYKADAISIVSAEYTDDEATRLDRKPNQVRIYDAYFEILRAPELTQAQQIGAAMPTILDVVTDLRHGLLLADHTADAMEFVGRLVGTIALDNAEINDDRAPASAWPAAVDAHRRWIAGHHLYGLANRAAAQALRRASVAYTLGDLAAVNKFLNMASEEVKALTAFLLYAAAITSLEYQTQVRPGMRQPAQPFPLTGGMNLDHADYRAELLGFLAICGENYMSLLMTAPEVAGSRDQLLQRDLYDLCVHIELTYRLVQGAPALDEHDQGSAIQALRDMQVDRIQEFSDWVRLGDWTSREICPDPEVHEGPAA